jgi:hypothetical protein
LYGYCVSSRHYGSVCHEWSDERDGGTVPAGMKRDEPIYSADYGVYQMLRIGFAFALGLTLLASTSIVRANEWDDFWDSVKVDWHRNNQWPHPFTDIDRSATMAPFAIQVANGWQRENLIGEEYFEENSRHLTAAGQQRIREILVQSPPEHRVIFVQRDLSDEITAKRLDAVQHSLAAVLPQGALPDVLVSNLTPSTRSADVVYRELDGYAKSAASTHLSGSDGAKASSGGSSGAGAAPSGGAGPN